ncbi:MAG TPA: rRNA adenine N-6-methyltransferase family protein [Candidatus Angelobacter sp.]
MTIEDYRRFYAEEISFVANLNSPALIEAFAKTPREKFLGPGPWQVGSPEARALAALGLGQASYITVDNPQHLYHNLIVVIDAARELNNGQPSALARWIDALDLKPGNRVYHLGSGVGYYTAIIAEMVGPGGSVVASEVDPGLAERAQNNLAEYKNVTVHAGDGATFDPGECDAMLINAGVTLPHALWLDRLGDGGRLVVPITMATSKTLGTGSMAKIVRHLDRFSVQGVGPVAIFSCTSLRDPEMEAALRKGLTTQTLFKVKSLRRDAHDAVESCVVHGSGMCLSILEPGAAQEPSNSAAVNA